MSSEFPYLPLRIIKWCKANGWHTCPSENYLPLTDKKAMKKKSSTDLAIDNMVAANCHADAPARETHLYRESLRALVRLAKSEHLLEMKVDIERLTGALAARAARRRTKGLLSAASAGQRSLELAGE